MSTLNLENAQVNVLMEVNGAVCLVAMTKEQLQAIETLVKMSVAELYKTSKTQADLNKFLGVRNSEMGI